MTRRLEGVDPDDCDTVSDAVADTTAFIRETRAELWEEFQADEPDEEKIEALSESLEEMPGLNDQLTTVLTSACGIGAYPTADGDPDIESDDFQTWHRTIDEMEADVADTVPDRLVENDIGYRDEVALETKKQSFFGHASRAKDAIEDAAESHGYDSDYDRDDRDPIGPETVVCKHPDPEKERECIEEYTDGRDVNWTGVSRTGEVYG